MGECVHVFTIKPPIRVSLSRLNFRSPASEFEAGFQPSIRHPSVRCRTSSRPSKVLTTAAPTHPSQPDKHLGHKYHADGERLPARCVLGINAVSIAAQLSGFWRRRTTPSPARGSEYRSRPENDPVQCPPSHSTLAYWRTPLMKVSSGSERRISPKCGYLTGTYMSPENLTTRLYHERFPPR